VTVGADTHHCGRSGRRRLARDTDAGDCDRATGNAIALDDLDARGRALAATVEARPAGAGSRAVAGELGDGGERGGHDQPADGEHGVTGALHQAVRLPRRGHRDARALN
jgi:hypothetical protein